MTTKVLTKAPPPFRGTEVHTLKNGFTVILKEDHTVPVVSMQVWARCGAVNETPRINGISHGLEHMVFKGTPSRSAGEISGIIEAQGGAMNAATQLETTHYYIDVPSYGADVALDVLADTVMNPTFPQEELERERLVILEEIHGRDDSPDATLWDEFASHVFHDTPYAIKVIGSEATVSALSQKDLFDYYRTFYTPSNQCVVVVGDLNKDHMLKKLDGLFGGIKSAEAPAMPAVNPPLNGANHVILKRPVQLTHIAMGFPTIGLGHEDVVALDLLADVIGGGASSRLYHKLREERQLALSFNCDFSTFSKQGLFSFFMETLPASAKELIAEASTELDDISRNPITVEELKRAKARVRSEWLHGSETPRGQASTLGSLAILGALDLVESYLARVETLTPSDLMAAFNGHVKGRKFYITQIDPAE